MKRAIVVLLAVCVFTLFSRAADGVWNQAGADPAPTYL